MKKVTIRIIGSLVLLLLLTGCGSDAKEAMPTEVEPVVMRTEQTLPAQTEPTLTEEETVPVTETTSPTVEKTEKLAEATEAASSADHADCYGEVLEQYLQAGAMDPKEFVSLYWNSADYEYYVNNDPENLKEMEGRQTVEDFYPYINRVMLYYYHQYGGEWDFVYTYRDIDGNGVE